VFWSTTAIGAERINPAALPAAAAVPVVAARILSPSPTLLSVKLWPCEIIFFAHAHGFVMHATAHTVLTERQRETLFALGHRDNNAA
jgi:hypothetical protein